MFHSFIPAYHGSSQSIPDGLMVRVLVKTVLSTMQHIILLKNSCLLENHSVVLGTVMLRRLYSGIIAKDTSPSLFLPQKPNIFISVRMICRSIRWNILDLSYFPFPIIFDLDCVQEFTPIFMSQGTMVLLIILQLIMHGWGESIPNSNSNIMNR